MADYPVRICLIGNISGPSDEGMKKVAHTLGATLGNIHEVLLLHVGEIASRSFWLKLKKFKPDIIFYIGGPSLITFMISRFTRNYCKFFNGKRPIVVIFALHPLLPPILERTSKYLKPDLMLVQSYQTEEKFQKFGMQTQFLPVGVNVEKFEPVDYQKKMCLRKKYGLNKNDFIVLHVGSVRRNRGLEILKKVQMTKGNRVLIIGSTSMPFDQSVCEELESSGCLVWHSFFPDVQELYQLADLYAFPVVDTHGCIELPLSVIEAMACNLPVVMTRFGAIPRVLEEKDGLAFVDNASDIPSNIEKIKNEKPIVKTSTMVSHFSWEKITESLLQCFSQLTEVRKN
jgi:glycosyltransferase involved in cell wall biosynthesis